MNRHPRQRIIRAFRAGVLTAALAFALVSTVSVALASSGDTIIHPALSINIPNLNLSDIKTGQGSTTSGVGIPWLGEYVNGIYRYGLGLAVIIATVMFMVGGFQYATAGGDKGRLDKAKQRITDAMVGVLILMGAYLLLATINPDLVSFAPIPIKAVVAEKFMLDNPQDGGLAPPDAFTSPKVDPNESVEASSGVPQDDSSDPQNGVINAASADNGATGTNTNGPNTPPPPTDPILYNGPIPDLYQPNNELGVTVSGSTPARRMYSVCVSSNPKYPAANDQQSILKRAAAITRVWIIEAVYKNGAIYDRGGSSADFWFVQHAYKGNSCMQAAVPYTEDAINSCSNQTSSCTAEGADYKAIWHSLQQAYQSCWTTGIVKAGFSIGQCSSWVLALAKCALGNKVDSSPSKKTLTWDTGAPIKVGKQIKIDAQPWKDAIATVGGAKPFDIYHLGKSAYGLCHSVMYIGGMGLRTSNGAPIYWVEMGGGGAADLGGGGGGVNGRSGHPFYDGGTHVGVSIHFNPFIDTFSRLGSCYTDAKTQMMVRLLDQVSP